MAATEAAIHQRFSRRIFTDSSQRTSLTDERICFCFSQKRFLSSSISGKGILFIAIARLQSNISPISFLSSIFSIILLQLTFILIRFNPILGTIFTIL